MDPRSEYLTRLDRWSHDRDALEQRFVRIGNWRLALGILEAVLAALAFGAHLIASWLLLLPFVAFVTLVIWHQRIIRRRTFAARAIRFYDAGLARLDDHWIGTGNSGDRYRDPAHVYAEDFDLFGKGSLFELITAARTAAGENTLASWLLAPAERDQALARQQAVRELETRLDLREDIALLGEDVRAEVHTESLHKWGSAPAVHFAPLLRPLALLLAIAGVATLLAFLATALPLWPFLAILGCDFLLIFALRQRVAQALESAGTSAQGLHILSLLLERLERESFEAPQLRQLRSVLEVQNVPASARIARLRKWIEWLDSSDHLLVRVIRPVLLLQEQIAIGIEQWRRENGSRIGAWVSAVAEFEALSSLASLAFERPTWTFPALIADAGPRFEAEALQHPLMASARCVPNDVALGDGLRLLIVSGSNMSGKSTLLRAVGLNAVLAWAGAPVAARSLRISSLQPGASIRVTDSLHDNRSRFFAEISRIRQIVGLANGSRPVLFLLDELLSGTNSHDRRIGAAGIVRKLVHSGAIGLITTHDLALAAIEQDLAPAVENVHFDDQIIDGRIEFDYRLRPGVVTHSNALELMRSVGLEV